MIYIRLLFILILSNSLTFAQSNIKLPTPDEANAEFSKHLSDREKKLLERQLKAGVGINYFEYWYPSHSIGLDVALSVTNYNKSPIKYIYCYLVAYDAVGGRLRSLGKDIVKLKLIGPVDFLATGESHFEDAFYSKVIDSVAFKKIEIEYMNGSKHTITNVKSVTRREGWLNRTEDNF